MIRLLVSTAFSCGLSSSKNSCARRISASFFSSIAPAPDPSSLSRRSVSFPGTLAAKTALHTHRYRSSFLTSNSADFSPSWRFSACRSLRLGFTARDSLKRDALSEQSLSNFPVLKDVSSLERQSLLHSIGSYARSIHGWLGGAMAAAICIFIATTFSKHDEDSRDDSIFTKATAVVQHSAMEIRKKAVVLYDSFCSTISTFVAKSSEAATAMVVLVQCVNAVLFTKGEDYANELALRWKLRVISLLADLAGSSHSRRRALIQAGNGSVVDWLLEAVQHTELEYRVIQAEAARALSHFLSDDITCDVVLGRQNALSQLLLFAASIQPNVSTKNLKLRKLAPFPENEEHTRGRSMLVSALMDIITSSCEIEAKGGIRPKLSGLADVKDISAALKVLQEGSLSLEDESNDDDDGEKGQNMNKVLGIGMTVSGETNVAAVQQQSLHSMLGPAWNILYSQGGNGLTSGKDWQAEATTDLAASGPTDSKEFMETKQGTGIHSLWDDLHGSHVAVLLAAWAIATWAQASSSNCSKIARLDKDGSAILACVLAPERTVKWHGATAARLLLENGFNQSAESWSGALLDTAKQASMADDAQLSFVALDSFYTCVKRSAQAREIAAKNSIVMLRDIAKQTSQIVSLPKVIAEILEILCFHTAGVSVEEGKKWSSILLYWLFNHNLQNSTRLIASRILAHVLDELGPTGIPLSQAWLAMVILDSINGAATNPINGDPSVAKSSKPKGLPQGRGSQLAGQAANELAKAVWLSVGEVQGPVYEKGVLDVSESDWGDLITLDLFKVVSKGSRKDKGKPMAATTMEITSKALKLLTELSVEDKGCQLRIIETGGLQLLRRFILKDDYEKVLVPQRGLTTITGPDQEEIHGSQEANVESGVVSNFQLPPAVQLRKHSARLLSILSLQPTARTFIREDEALCKWLEACANSQISIFNELKTCSYARATLLNLYSNTQNKGLEMEQQYPHYEDKVFIVNTDSPFWRWDDLVDVAGSTVGRCVTGVGNKSSSNFDMDVVFVHGLRGGPFKTWRIADDKTSSTDKAGLVERIDVDSGREGSCWPKEWLSSDIPTCRLLTVKYKTNLSQWSGESLPLQEVSAMLLEKLSAAGVGERPLVFITHSMGGLVVKQMLMQASKDKKYSQVIKNTSGIVFYSCPHFGSKLADMPWRLGLVLRPAPTINELRSGSVRLEELNQLIRTLNKGGVEVLSFSETKVTPLVEGYGGWALRMEVVPIESAYPGFGEFVVLDGTDHVNACKPLNRNDIAYTQTLQFLQKIAKSVKSSHS